MAASVVLASVNEVEAFINEYFGVWQGTDEDRIMSYYSEHVALQIPGALMQGKKAVRELFVRPFITGFPGNRHVAKNMILGMCLTPVGTIDNIWEWTIIHGTCGSSTRGFAVRRRVASTFSSCAGRMVSVVRGAAATGRGQVAAACVNARVADTSPRSRRARSSRTPGHPCGYGFRRCGG